MKIVVLFFLILVVQGCSTTLPPVIIDDKASVIERKVAILEHNERFNNEKLLLKNKRYQFIGHRKLELIDWGHFYKAKNNETGRDELILKESVHIKSLGNRREARFLAPKNIDLGLDTIEKVKQFRLDSDENIPSTMLTANFFKGRAASCESKQAWVFRHGRAASYSHSMSLTTALGIGEDVICMEGEPKIFLSSDTRQIVIFSEKKYNQQTKVMVFDIPRYERPTYKVTTMWNVKEKRFAGIKRYSHTKHELIVADEAGRDGFKVLQSVDVDTEYDTREPVINTKQTIRIDLIKK